MPHFRWRVGWASRMLNAGAGVEPGAGAAASCLSESAARAAAIPSLDAENDGTGRSLIRVDPSQCRALVRVPPPLALIMLRHGVSAAVVKDNRNNGPDHSSSRRATDARRLNRRAP